MNRLGWEERLRGAGIALVIFLAATGAWTALVFTPSLTIQSLQRAHLLAGAIAAALGAIYLPLHIAQVMGGGRKLARRAALAAVPLLAIAFMNPVLERVIPDPVFAEWLSAKLWMTLLLVAVVMIATRAARYLKRLTAPVATGGPAAGFAAAVALSGLGIAFGLSLYGKAAAAPPLIHQAMSVAALAAVPAHVMAARRRRNTQARGGERVYRWRAVLIRVTVPCLGFLVLATSVFTWRARADTPVIAIDSRRLAPMDVGFSEVVPSGCVLCHPEVSDDWHGSAHALAANNPFFTGLIRNLWTDRGPEAVRVCLRCHAPHSPDPTQAPLAEVLGSEGYGSGVHCLSCHRMRPGSGHGDGSLVTTPLAADGLFPLSDGPGPVARTVRSSPLYTRALIAGRLGLHRERFRFATRDSTTCLPCHVQTLGASTDGRLTDVLQDQYDSWEGSSIATRGQTCTGCHMPRYMSIHLYTLVDHRMAAASTYIASVTGDPNRMSAVALHLQGTPVPRPERMGQVSLDAPGSLLSMSAELANGGQGPELVVKTWHEGRIGHSFPNGPSDLFQVWLSASVRDARGSTLLDVGATGPEGAPRLGHALLDSSGEWIRDHRLGSAERLVDLGTVPADGTHELRLPIAATDPVLPLSVEAHWNYRRLDPMVVAKVTGTTAPDLPAIVLGRVSRQVTSEPGAHD